MEKVTINNVVYVNPETMATLIVQSGRVEEIEKTLNDLIAWKKNPDNPDPSDGEFVLMVADTMFKLRS
jgi:hypothetical protein